MAKNRALFRKAKKASLFAQQKEDSFLAAVLGERM